MVECTGLNSAPSLCGFGQIFLCLSFLTYKKGIISIIVPIIRAVVKNHVRLNKKHLDKALVIHKHLINVSYFCYCDLQRPYRFSCPSSSSSQWVSKRPERLTCAKSYFGLFYCRQGSKLPLLYGMLPFWSMAWILILETQGKFQQGIPLQLTIPCIIPHRVYRDFRCLWVTWFLGVELPRYDQHLAEWRYLWFRWCQDGIVVKSHGLTPDRLDGNLGSSLYTRPEILDQLLNILKPQVTHE